MTRAIFLFSIWIAFFALVAAVAHLAHSDALVRRAEEARVRGASAARTFDVVGAHAPDTVARTEGTATSRGPDVLVERASAVATHAPLASDAETAPNRELASSEGSATQTSIAANATAPSASSSFAPTAIASAIAPQTPPPTPAPTPKDNPKRPKRGGDDEDGGSGLGRLPPGVPPEFEGLGVRVVNHLTGSSAGNVRVRWATQPLLDELVAQGRSLDRDDPEDLLASSKEPLMTDAQGIAITPSAPGRMLIDARIGSLYGYTWIDRNHTAQARIELSEDREIVARTTDSNGAPLAGVTVIVRDSSCTELWRGETSGDDAKAHFRHAMFRIERDASPGDCWILAEGVMPGANAVRIERAKMPVEEVRLDVAPSARVGVRVSDPEGAPIAQNVRVAMSARGVPALCGRRVERATKNGEAIFERVEIGRELSIDVDGNGVFEDLHVDASGPEAVGRDRTVQARFTRRWPVAKFTCVDGADKALASAKIAGWTVQRDAGGVRYTALEGLASGGTSLETALETDASGHARLALRIPSSGAGPESVCLALRNSSGDWFSSASFVLPSDWKSGERDFGTLRFAEMPVLAAGYAIDDRGAAVEARIEISSAADATTPIESFVTDPRWTARTDTRGYFKLRGLVSGQALAISASAVGHVPVARMPQKLGDVKTKITLPRCSALTGRVLLPGRLPSDWVRLSIETDDEAMPLRLDVGGWFRCSALQPGPFAFNVYVEGIEEPVHRIDRIDVRAGVDVNDGRLSLIDLRNRVIFVTLFVLAADGGAFETGELRLLEHVGDEEKTRTLPLTGGFVSFATVDPAMKATIVVPGFVTQELSGLTGDSEVRLEREKR